MSADGDCCPNRAEDKFDKPELRVVILCDDRGKTFAEWTHQRQLRYYDWKKQATACRPTSGQ